jgi:hypothetical protein
MLRIFFQEKTTNTINFSNDIIILFLFGFTEFASSIFLLIAIIKIFNNIFEENYYLNYYFKKVFDLIKLKKEKILLISEFLATIVIFALLSTSVFEILFLLKKNSFDTTNQKYFFSENYKFLATKSYNVSKSVCISMRLNLLFSNSNFFTKILEKLSIANDKSEKLTRMSACSSLSLVEKNDSSKDWAIIPLY